MCRFSIVPFDGYDCENSCEFSCVIWFQFWAILFSEKYFQFQNVFENQMYCVTCAILRDRSAFQFFEMTINHCGHNASLLQCRVWYCWFSTYKKRYRIDFPATHLLTCQIYIIEIGIRSSWAHLILAITKLSVNLLSLSKSVTTINTKIRKMCVEKRRWTTHTTLILSIAIRSIFSISDFSICIQSKSMPTAATKNSFHLNRTFWIERERRKKNVPKDIRETNFGDAHIN